MRFGLFNHIDPGVNAGDVFLNQRFDLFCRRRRVLRQVTHFGCYHRKSTTRFTGSRGFHDDVPVEDVVITRAVIVE